MIQQNISLVTAIANQKAHVCAFRGHFLIIGEGNIIGQVNIPTECLNFIKQ